MSRISVARAGRWEFAAEGRVDLFDACSFTEQGDGACECSWVAVGLPRPHRAPLRGLRRPRTGTIIRLNSRISRTKSEVRITIARTLESPHYINLYLISSSITLLLRQNHCWQGSC